MIKNLIAEIGTPEIGIPVNECRHVVSARLVEAENFDWRLSESQIKGS